MEPMDVRGSSSPLSPQGPPEGGDKKPSKLPQILANTKLGEFLEARRADPKKIEQYKAAFAAFKQALAEAKVSPGTEKAAPRHIQEPKRLDAYDIEAEDVPEPAIRKKAPQGDVDPQTFAVLLRHAEKLEKREEARFTRLESGRTTLLDTKAGLERKIEELEQRTAQLKEPSSYSWTLLDRMKATPAEVKEQIKGIVLKVLGKGEKSLPTKLREGAFLREFNEFATRVGNARIIAVPALASDVQEAFQAMADIGITSIKFKTIPKKQLLEKYSLLQNASKKLVDAQNSYVGYVAILRKGTFLEEFKEFAALIGNARVIDDPVVQSALQSAEEVLATLNISKSDPKTIPEEHLLKKYAALMKGKKELAAIVEANPQYKSLVTAKPKLPKKPVAAAVVAPTVPPKPNLARELHDVRAKKQELIAQMPEPVKAIMDRLGTEGMLTLGLDDIQGFSEEEQYMLIDMTNLLTEERALKLSLAKFKIKPKEQGE